jgi:hypothetical protein
MAKIDPIYDNDETELERAKAALRDIRHKRKIERQRWENEERRMKLHEETLRRFIASGGNVSEGSAGTNTFHASVVVSSS